MKLGDFIIKYIPYSDIFLFKDGELLGTIDSARKKREKADELIILSPEIKLFKHKVLDKDIQNKLLETTNFIVDAGHNHINIIIIK